MIRNYAVSMVAVGMLCAFAVLPVQVFADTVTSTAPTCSSNSLINYLEQGVDLATSSSGCGSTGDVTAGIQSLAGRVVNVFSIIVGIVAVIMVIYGGFRYITSGGDSSNVSSAKNTLIYAIIGLVIVALAQLIVHYVLNTAAGVAGSSGI